jgi:hypothetical protein
VNFVKRKNEKTVEVVGIVDTSLIGDISSIKFMIDNEQIAHSFHSLSISEWLKILAGGKKLRSFSTLREYLKHFTRNIDSIQLKNKIQFSLSIPEAFFNINNVKAISCYADSVELNMFVTRNVAKYGIKSNFLDLNLDYALIKSWSTMPIILGYIKHDAGMFPKYGQINCGFTETRLISNSIQLLNPGCVQHKRIRGARIVHGQVIVDEKYLYPIDTLKIPEVLNVRSLPAPYWRADHDSAVYPKCLRSLGRVEEAIFVGGTNNLMHFAIEEIPKLYQLSLMDIPANVPLILRNDLSIQIREMFGALSNRKLIFIGNYEDISVENLHIIQFNNPLQTSMLGDKSADKTLFNSNAMEWARGRFRSLVSLSSTTSKIQIKRERGLFRQLTNVEELARVLEIRFGFQPLFTGNLTLEFAVEKFHDAKFVIGEYGAGLANIIFCPPGAKVIEIRGPAEENAREYYLLCRSLDIEHFLLVGRKKHLSKYGFGNAQFEVEVKNLIEIVKNHMVDGST